MGRDNSVSQQPPVVVTAVLIGAAAFVTALVGAQALVRLLKLGTLSGHMVEHMALLAVAAPITAGVLRGRFVDVAGGALVSATILQLSLIWLWHAPPVLTAAGSSTPLHVAMGLSLFVAGVLFWSAVYGVAQRSRWKSVLALLLTGKLFCLYAAILVFAPRVLYAGGEHSHHGGSVGIDLADQQLAGMIMITVCPLTYVAAGIALTVRWIYAIERNSSRKLPTQAGSCRSIGAVVAPFITLLGGCEGAQSALSPASPEADSAFQLTVVLFVGGAVIFLLVLLVLMLALIGTPRQRAAILGERIVVLGGIVFPVVVLTALLGYGFWLARAGEVARLGEQIIHIKGERWWWRVSYVDEQLGHIASANEIRLAAGRPVRILLTSDNVIHSFWVPALAGKVDMIPGRTNEIRFTPQKEGVYRGQCAEYCGGAHALMGLRAIVLSPEKYTEWLASVRRPPAEPKNEVERKGARSFMARCSGCHAVRGTLAGGVLGPDLTHLAARSTIGADVLPMSEAAIAAWITNNDDLKPGNLMPEYQHVSSDEVMGLTTYLGSLK